ncbi:hypothetical protein O3G_MSEX008981 [Manduca sexta]|uniref:Tetratricopeptide repeat protein 17 n=1 Tax=Manduca sexta TaxID=7130 RepID=A0A922CPW1_MANSE|nr:hypothetical protein O3G_MSEX008981 [Manduca sexta]
MDAIKMKCLNILLLLSLCITNAQASTHWMVTETGLIQPRIDSPFEMARPYDLLAFLNQDTRWDNIINLYHDLQKRQQNIEKLWSDLEKAVDFSTILTLDKHCVKVGQLTSIDWYASFLEDGKSKGIADEEYMLHDNNYGDTDVPDCKKLSSLTFSMFTFEHLQGMIRRENLTASPELSLPEQIAPIMTVDPFGHWLATILRKNSSSWLHYNMASLYWRVRGNAPKAMECSRRAVHYAPREYKDVALLSMGSILHRSKMPEDALIILTAALDHDVGHPYNHFALANAYAIVGEYNNSVKHFEECLKLNPTFELAKKHKNAVLCHMFFTEKMKNIEETLNKLREELTEFNNKEVDWLKSQAAFLRTMKHAEEFDYRDVEKNCVRMTELTGLNINELKHQGDKSSLIKYFLDSPMYDEKWFEVRGVDIIESAYSLQRLVNHINKQAHMVSSFVIPSDQFRVQDGKIVRDPQMMDLSGNAPEKGKPVAESAEAKTESPKLSDKKIVHKENHISEFDTGIIMYPPTMKINRYQKDFDVETDWPSSRQCKESASSLPENIEAIYPVFLPFENKGLRISSLLSDKIGVPASVEYELPWHPPTCPNDKDAAAFTQKKGQKPQFVSEVVATKYLREKLLEYVGDGDPELVRNMQDAEIGQRIYAAMQMKLAPKWLLYTLSSLYWRVRNNNVNALHCLLTASRTVETKYRDIVLTSLASVYLEMGYFDEALTAAEESFRLSLYEPATNFVLAELNMVKKHRNTHLLHLKQVVRVEPRYLGGLARGLLLGWACILKQVDVLHELEYSEGDICTQMEPGISMVCEKDGSNCHVANIHCFSNHERESSSGIVRMLELKDDNIQGVAIDDIDGAIFDPIISNMPAERTDKQAHQKNYEAMLKIIDKAVKACGARGCYNVQAEDFTLKEEECSHQKLQLSYWLHIISFRQLFSDTELSFPNEITAMTPSNKKVPECRMPSDAMDDFFLERVSKVDGEGWEPILSLMHQFAEMFNFYDYITLGAKIAKFIDTAIETPRW